MSQTTRPPGPPGDIEPAGPGSVYDALTDLFLGEGAMAPVKAEGAGAPKANVPEQARPAATIEGLILGHLPVLASAWVGQYARHLATTTGRSVALLRLKAGSAILEVVGAPRSADEHAGVDVAFGEALSEAAELATAWVIGVDPTNEPGLAELHRDGAVDTITVLTGADEAAVVACYRTIKSLLAHAEADEDEVEQAGGSSVQLAVMGAAPEKADEASAKIAKAAATFLGHAPRVVACVSKIGSLPARTLYRGPEERSVKELIAHIRAASAGRVGRPLMVAKGSPQGPAPYSVTPVVQPPAAAPTVVASTPAPIPVAPPRAVAEPIVASRIGVQAGGTGEGFVAMIGGVRGLPVRCPHAPGVEVGLAGDGGVHLVHGPEADAAVAVGRLVVAAAWVNTNAGLLSMAVSGMNAQARPSMHVVGESAAALRPLMDSDVRLHLLVRTPNGNVLAPLN